MMSYWVLFIGIAVVSWLVQMNLQNKFKKYSKIPTGNGMTGRDVALKMLHDNGIYDVQVTHTPGRLTDHYNPTNKTVNLSEGVYESNSIMAAAVAAHECGHAIQDKNKYIPMRIRSAIVPFVNICTRLGYLAILIGLIFNRAPLLEAGIILLLAMLVFQLITLPVEFNASKRALNELEKEKILDKEEKGNARNMLVAAAFTYVASVLSTLLQIFRLVLISSSSDRRH